jgi:hypothetical protein
MTGIIHFFIFCMFSSTHGSQCDSEYSYIPGYIIKDESNCGASVAKWLAHLPFTSEAAGSNLTKYFLNATRTQSSCEKSKSQRSAESRGFSPGTPVSSHRES